MSDSTISVLNSCNYWLRIAVALRVCLKEALLDILHDKSINGLSRDEREANKVLLKLREHEEDNLKHIITPAQWEKICHICVPEMCEQPCSKNGTTTTKTLDIPSIIFLIIIKTDLPPPLGRKAWSQPTPKLGDGTIAANVLLARRLVSNIFTGNSPRDIKNEDQFVDEWEDIEIILLGLRYANVESFYAIETSSLTGYYQEVLAILSERTNKMISLGSRVFKPEFEAMKQILEAFLNSVDESKLDDTDYSVITSMLEKQSTIEETMKVKEDKENIEGEEKDGESQQDNIDEDNEQMLRCVVEGMKLHLSGYSGGDDSGGERTIDDSVEDLLQKSKDLKEAYRVRFQMATGTPNTEWQSEKPSQIKVSLANATERYYGNEYVEVPSMMQAIREHIVRQKKLTTNEKKVTNYEDIVKDRDQYTVVVGLEGSGKTTLVDTILYQWGCNKLWGSNSKLQFNLVFVLYFRQLVRFQNQPDITAEGILDHFYPNFPLESLLQVGTRITSLLILEGFDQFSHKEELLKKTEEPSLYTKAVYDLMNPRNAGLPFTRLVTSHPSGLRILGNISIIPKIESKDSPLVVIENTGFGFYNVNQYIAKYFEQDSLPYETVDAVKTFRLVYDLMKIPSYCRGICSLMEMKLLEMNKIPTSYTSLLSMMLLSQLWQRQFKEASTLNGVYIKPEFKETCINLAAVAFQLKKKKLSKVCLKDLPSDMNIEILLKSGLLIKLNDNLNKPKSFCYQFLHQMFQEFLEALHLFYNGFDANHAVTNKSVLAMLGGLVGAAMQDSKSDTHLQKFAKHFNGQQLKLDTILTNCNGRNSERMSYLHSYLRSIREDDSKTSKELGALLNKQNKNSKSRTLLNEDVPCDDANISFDGSPGLNALILFEYGFKNLENVEQRPVSILVSSLKGLMSNELQQELKRLSTEKKLKLL